MGPVDEDECEEDVAVCSGTDDDEDDSQIWEFDCCAREADGDHWAEGGICEVCSCTWGAGGDEREEGVTFGDAFTSPR